MEAGQYQSVPSLREIVATDGHVAFLARFGLGLATVLAVLFVILQAGDRLGTAGLQVFWWRWVTVLAPLLLLWPTAVLWARAVQAVFRHGAAVPGKVTARRTSVHGLLIVEFTFSVDGMTRHRSNHLVPQARAKQLTPGRLVQVLATESAFPGPLIADVYEPSMPP